MLENSSIVCFAKDWGGDPTSKNHIMRILSARNRILWVNSIGIRRPGANKRDLWRLVEKLRGGLGGCRQVAENIHVFSPLVIPLPEVGPVVRLNNLVLSAALRATCRRLGLRRPIVWSFLPNVGGLVGRLQERMVIYHCVDDYAEFRGMPRAALRRLERELLAVADLVFTSSETLRQERLRYNPNTFYIPHGVPVASFSRALDPHLALPSDLAGLPRPIVGFIGAVADFVDLELIAEAARARPHWSFALVGRWVTDLTALRGLPNVHLLGQRPYDVLPAYCRGFDVGVIPFRINALTVRSNPLKLREYLAAGLPVVSTSLPEVARYDGLVRIARARGDFVHEIEQALDERGEPHVRRRLTAMREESWERRVEELSDHVTEVLRARERATIAGRA